MYNNIYILQLIRNLSLCSPPSIKLGTLHSSLESRYSSFLSPFKFFFVTYGEKMEPIDSESLKLADVFYSEVKQNLTSFYL